ncbi:SAM-dependent methyltransferase [Dactylosporangium fulvum]|uniref:SAM-dependent methyltransferase n=1 Tax=Dactylosporangium fulvum TaxID=53359 RepID=A0ABY5WD55_9ACTN|nr:SAM-dependent methyltransferase [Dactylosporangium fulvum]UWP87166.1 SAM-dependent methyltransferase [Dactylosporangium fulvum]
MSLPDWAPDGVDTTVPNAARVYDYALGGYHNFAVDREFAEQAMKAWPGIGRVAYANRAYLGRAVEWLVDAGVRQFLDIGSGIPTLGNVHEVAQALTPEARVMYVDIDEVAVTHSQAILAGNTRAAAVQGDLRRPQGILADPRVQELLDFGQPVAVLLVAVLHFVADEDDPAGIVRELSDALVGGSYVAVSHFTRTTGLDQEQDQVTKLYDQTPTSVRARTPQQVATILGGLELVEPGVVPATAWHPDPEEEREPEQAAVLAAMGYKPARS